MQINVEWDVLRQRRLMIATPMYGGMCTSEYLRAMLQLVSYCQANQIYLETQFISNESLITRARNYLVDSFLRSTCTHLMFIDADVGFTAEQVISLLALQGINAEDDEYDVISAPYPKKNISWEKVKQAVDKGIADDDPEELRNFVGDFVFNPIEKGYDYQIDLKVPVQIQEAGTGFMMIRRPTFDKWKAAYPDQSYRPDSPRSADFAGDREIVAYFDCIIDPESRRYLSEDYMFCHNSTKIGLKIWMCAWMQLTHYGNYAFSGSLPHLALVGADGTAYDVQMAKHKKKVGKK